METCYKVMRREIFQSIDLRSNDFRIELRFREGTPAGFRIYEVPISYMGRTYEEGKKIKKIDGLKAIVMRCAAAHGAARHLRSSRSSLTQLLTRWMRGIAMQRQPVNVLCR
jgi:hypothetical protein